LAMVVWLPLTANVDWEEFPAPTIVEPFETEVEPVVKFEAKVEPVKFDAEVVAFKFEATVVSETFDVDTFTDPEIVDVLLIAIDVVPLNAIVDVSETFELDGVD